MATGKATIKNYQKDKGYEIIPRELLQHCDKKAKDKNGNEHGKNGLSLEAIGLLINLQSYPEDWELNKTELYTRYSKNGRKQIVRIWQELVEHKYIVQFKKRNKQKYDYIYYFSVIPFDDEMIRNIERQENSKSVENFKYKKTEESQKAQEQEILDCPKRTVQNEQSKMNSSERTANRLHIKNNTHKQNTQIRNEYSEISDKDNHSTHSNHSTIEFDYYTDDLPDPLKGVLKPFKISEIKILKRLMLKAISYVNREYDYPKAITINEVAYDFVKTINKVQFRRKKKYEEFNIEESIDELQPFLFESFRNAVISYQDKLNDNESYTEPHREPNVRREGKSAEKKQKASKELKYASDDEYTRKLIENFRNS